MEMMTAEELAGLKAVAMAANGKAFLSWEGCAFYDMVNPSTILRLVEQAGRVSGLESARIAYASEFPLNADGEPDVGNIHANIRALKAKIDAPAPPEVAVEQKPVAHLKFWARQSMMGSQDNGPDHAEGLEVCDAGEVGDDGELAFPVYTSPAAPAAPVTASEAAGEIVWGPGLSVRWTSGGIPSLGTKLYLATPAAPADAKLRRCSKFGHRCNCATDCDPALPHPSVAKSSPQAPKTEGGE